MQPALIGISSDPVFPFTPVHTKGVAAYMAPFDGHAILQGPIPVYGPITVDVATAVATSTANATNNSKLIERLRPCRARAKSELSNGVHFKWFTAASKRMAANAAILSAKACW